ncbi:MAG: fatty acid kinase [Oceanotoga sp.]|uniref:DAK2 domain-containing protein n=1 Tax=Oceanotoga sp. TaxID=2108366 RepID=UPI00264E173E|nr:DAK2 domain-containing protein [Oceanotoga sp.]MDN5342019.1 fatty acid kinase [Oceanotoga sp.]
MKEYLEGKDLYIAIKKAAEVLVKNRDEINALNVFPVPDGDTGSNMSSAILEAVQWLDKVKNNNNLKEVLKALRDGLLMGARGNSGVILSQIFRGFTEALDGKKKITTKDFIMALDNAKEVAYGAVIKPVEGTMLTLIRRLSERAREELSEITDFLEFMDKLSIISFEIVDETPKYLKKLREAKVVDAGAKGLAYILKGFRDAIHGDTEVNIAQIENATSSEIAEIAYEDLTFQYCTECVLQLANEDLTKEELDTIRNFLEEIGDSIVLVHQNEYLKCHVHTNHPGNVFEKFLEYGDLMKVKADNMKVQHEHVVENINANKEKKIEEIEVEDDEDRKWGIVAVSPGIGITNVLKSLGVNRVISGGQTMNPSIKDISDSINSMQYENIIILPNNPNIVMTAEKAAEMSEKNVIVIPTKYVQEGVSAMLGFDDSLEAEDLKNSMTEYVKGIIPVDVTYAVRDSEISGQQIKKDEYLVFAGKDLKAHGDNLYIETEKVLLDFLEEGYEIVTIFYGEGSNLEDINNMINNIMQKEPNVEIEIHEGGQNHYPMLISLE